VCPGGLAAGATAETDERSFEARVAAGSSRFTMAMWVKKRRGPPRRRFQSGVGSRRVRPREGLQGMGPGGSEDLGRLDPRHVAGARRGSGGPAGPVVSRARATEARNGRPPPLAAFGEQAGILGGWLPGRRKKSRTGRGRCLDGRGTRLGGCAGWRAATRAALPPPAAGPKPGGNRVAGGGRHAALVPRAWSLLSVTDGRVGWVYGGGKRPGVGPGRG